MIVPFANPIPHELHNPGVALPIELERRGGEWMDEGVWVEDTTTTQLIGRGFVYPSTTDDLVALPEGERIVKSLTLIAPMRFEMNDRLQYEGEEYRIVHIAPWHNFGYQFAIAQVNQIHE